MRKLIKYSLSLGIAVSAFSTLANVDVVLSESQLETAHKLIEEAQKSDLAYEIVESLTTEVGARLAGSEAEQRARKWGEALGEELGFDRVSIEEFSMPFWGRGNLHVSLSKPYDQRLYGTALGGGAASKGEIKSEIVYFRSIEELKNVTEGQLEGKVACVGWQHAERGGAVGLLVRSVGSDSHRFPHTGMMSAKEGNWSNIPVIAVSNPDADQIRRLHNLPVVM